MLDETNAREQDVTTSANADGSTSEKETELLPKKTVEAMVSKAKSDALAELGRYKKAADEAVKQVQAIEGRLSRLQEERFESELESAKDDPDRLREIKRRQAEAKERMSTEADKRKWEAEKADYEERIRRAEAIERRDLAREIASESQVDYRTLEKFATDRESMRELAKDLPKSGDAQGGQGNRGSRETESPEGGKTKGGGSGRIPTTEELKASTPFETAAKIKSGEWKVRGWSP